MSVIQRTRQLLYKVFGKRVAASIHRTYKSIARVFENEFTQEEKLLLHAVSGLIGKGTVVLDIGAHTGAWSRQLSSLVGSDGFVVAFEPVPEKFYSITEAN